MDLRGWNAEDKNSIEQNRSGPGVTNRKMKCIRMEKRTLENVYEMIVLYKLLIEFW